MVALVGLQTEAAALLQQQQMLARFGLEQRGQLAVQAIEIGSALQFHAPLLPREGSGGEGCDLRVATALHTHRQDLTTLVVVVAGKAIRLGRSRIPGFGVDRFEAMPVAEGDVVELLQEWSVELQTVVGAAGVVLVGVQIGGGKTMHRAMGQQDARLVCRPFLPVELPHPAGGIVAFAAAQQGAGQHHGVVQFHGPALQQHLQLRGAALLLALEKGAVPHAPRSAMVMVARDHQHRDAQPADGLTHRAHIAAAWRG